MHDPTRMSRRDFIILTATGAAAAGLTGKAVGQAGPAEKAKVALVKTSDRAGGVVEALRLISFDPPGGKNVFIKPNFNTSDPPPGSTHIGTLRALILDLKKRGASGFTIGDRSGPEPTKTVLEKKELPALAAETGAVVVDFEELAEGDWIHLTPAGSHWKNGFDFARPLAESDYPVALCCLKTHQFGGVHTMSLKLTVGAVHRKYMRELHGSPDQRKMIAEINLGYRPKVIVMDGMEAFTDGGPMTGTLSHPGVVVAGTDRVAVDAVGLAILKDLGTNEAIMSKKIFEQDQLARAVELGLGICGPEGIDLVVPDAESRNYAGKLRAILDKEAQK